MKSKFAAFLLLSLFAVSTFLNAETPPVQIAQEYSVELESQVQGQTVKTKMFVTKDKTRTESEMMGMKTVSILRKDKGVMWTILAMQKMVMESPLQPEVQQIDPQEYAKAATWEKVGDETIDGVDCAKWKGTIKKDDKSLEGYYWVSKSNNYPVQVEFSGVISKWKNYNPAKPDDSLFELVVPEGYTKMEMPGAAAS